MRIADVIRSHSVTVFLQEKGSIGYSPGPWALQSQISGHPGSVGYGFHFVEWALSQIRDWLVTPSRFVPSLHQYILQAGATVEQSIYSCVGVYRSPSVACRAPSSTKSTGQALGRYQFSLSTKVYCVTISNSQKLPLMSLSLSFFKEGTWPKNENIP